MTAVRAILRNENRIDFPRLWKPVLSLSAAVLVVVLVTLFVSGLNLGIEFEGGASWEVRSDTASISDLRDGLEPFGLADARIQKVANELYRVRAEVDSASSLEEIKLGLAEAAGVTGADVTANAIGASWGSEVTAKARTALIVFFIVLFVYISLRLDWKMALAALVAVVHDILLSVGLYSVFQLEVTSATVIAFLTILGYSLYDTLVVFDKIRDNEARAAGVSAITYTDVTSYSLNQVLVRSINTTITSVLPVLAVLVVGRFILGAVTLQEFALALLVGLLAGTYSSLFVATPIAAWLKEREPGNIDRRSQADKLGGDIDIDVAAELAKVDRAKRVRSTARGEGHRVTKGRSALTPAVTKRRSSEGDPGSESGGAAGKRDQPTGQARTPTGAIKPRPRKKKR